MERSRGELEALERALQLLAADAKVQLQALGVLRRIAEELRAGVIELHRVEDRLRAAEAISPAAHGFIARLDAALDSMVGDEGLWTAEGVRTAAQWRDIRHLASDALDSLGVRDRRARLPRADFDPR